MGKREKGILLFGTNAVGKSSLIKSIGICISHGTSRFVCSLFELFFLSAL